MNIKRYIYLDNIKWALVMLVIIHHSASTAGLDPIGFNLPHVMKSMKWQYDVLGNINGINQSFFMSLFFFISAYFVTPSFVRKGASRFMLDKLKRLGIPILMTIFIITPIMVGIISHFMHYKITAQGTNNLTYGLILNHIVAPLFKTGNIDLGVTWFIWTLIVFNVFFVLSQKLPFLNKPKVVDKKIPAIWKMTLFAVVIIPINYLGMYLDNHLGDTFLGFKHLKYFPMYITMFYFGIQAFKYKWLDQLEFKHAFWGILMWLLGQAFLGPIARGYGLSSDMMARGFTVIGMCMFLIYAFKILFDTKNQWTAILSRSAFAAYVVQVIPLTFIAGIYWPYMTQTPIINFIVIAVPSVILTFLLGFVICKLPVLKHIF
jgi:glucan biosynthesis protein C